MDYSLFVKIEKVTDSLENVLELNGDKNNIFRGFTGKLDADVAYDKERFSL